MSAPLLILPFHPHNDINDQCWVFNLGDLAVETDPQVFKNAKKLYDMYNISLNNIRMQYYKSVDFFYQCEEQSLTGNS